MIYTVNEIMVNFILKYLPNQNFYNASIVSSTMRVLYTGLNNNDN